jgi:8-oxo-dGTP diphosphatase
MTALGRSIAGIAAEEGKIFIARRGAGGDLGGKWEFPGGKVEEGESDTEALVREFGEEFGAPITAGPFVGAASFVHHGITRVLKAYRVFFHAPHRITLREHTEYRWAALEEIPALDFADSDLKLLPALKAYFDREPRV